MGSLCAAAAVLLGAGRGSVASKGRSADVVMDDVSDDVTDADETGNDAGCKK